MPSGLFRQVLGRFNGGGQVQKAGFQEGCILGLRGRARHCGHWVNALVDQDGWGFPRMYMVVN